MLLRQAHEVEEIMSTDRAEELHLLLFPEEYDEVNDSILDAKERRRGINPMSADYIEYRDSLRSELGFGPYQVNANATTTLEWVKSKVQSGYEDELVKILRKREVQVNSAPKGSTR